MLQRGFKLLADGSQEIRYALATNPYTQHQCVDKHTHCIGQAYVRTPIADSGQRDALTVCEACQRIADGSQCQVGRRYLMLPTEQLCSVQVKRTADRFRLTLRQRICQVGRYLRNFLAFVQLLSEEFFCCCVFRTFFCLSLPCNVLCITISLSFNSVSFQHLA